MPAPYPPNYVIEEYWPASQFAIGLAAFVPILTGAGVSLQAMLYGTFGFGPLSLGFQAQLNAALGLQFSWNPAAAISANAQIGLALNNLVPKVGLQANASIAAGLQLKIGGISLLMNMGIQLSIDLGNLLLSVNGFLGLPGCYYALYYGPVGNIQSWNHVLSIIGGSGNVGFMLIAASTDIHAACGALFALHP